MFGRCSGRFKAARGRRPLPIPQIRRGGACPSPATGRTNAGAGTGDTSSAPVYALGHLPLKGKASGPSGTPAPTGADVPDCESAGGASPSPTGADVPGCGVRGPSGTPAPTNADDGPSGTPASTENRMYNTGRRGSSSPRTKKYPKENFRVLFIGFLFDLGLADLVDVTGEVDHLVGEAPLVVVPGDELDKVAVEGDAGLGVENGGVRVGAEVGGDDLVVNILQNALHGAFGSGLDGGADLGVGGGLLEAHGQVDDGHVRSGDTH